MEKNRSVVDLYCAYLPLASTSEYGVRLLKIPKKLNFGGACVLYYRMVYVSCVTMVD
jgi:hypothetical protein